MGLIQGGNIDSITMAGVTIARESAIILTGSLVGSGKNQTLKKSGVNYKVTAGKKLKILAARMQMNVVNAQSMVIGHGDTAVENSSSPPINSIFIPTGATNSFYSSSTANTPHEKALFFEIPENKYPYIYSIQDCAQFIELLCIEE